MKQQFRFKLEDGTVVTGTNPVEALMKVSAGTTGKNLDTKFAKEVKEKENVEALTEFEKAYNQYLELEKNLGKKSIIENAPESVKTTPSIEPEKPEENADESEEKPEGPVELEVKTEKSEVVDQETKMESAEFKPGVVQNPSVLINEQAADKWLEGNLINEIGDKRIVRLAELKDLVNKDRRISDQDKTLSLDAIVREEKRLEQEKTNSNKTNPKDEIVQKTKDLEEIFDNNKTESIETIKLNKEQIKVEIENNLKQLLEKAGDADPRIKKFDITADGDTITINSKINIDTGYFARINFDISVPIKDNGKTIELGKHNIEAGLATGKVRKKIEPNLPLLIPNITNYFEDKYNKKIDSIRISGGELILNFK